MLDELDKQTPKPRDGSERLSGLLAFIAFAIFLWTVLVYPTERYYAAISAEGRALQSALGGEAFRAIERRTNAWFEVVMHDSGLLDQVLKPMLPLNNTDSPAARMWDNVAGVITVFVNNLQLLTYQILLRLHTMGAWLWVFTPFVCAQIYGGFQGWRRKRHVFGLDSKNKYQLIRRATVISLLSTLLYFIAPGVTGTLTTYLPPVALLCFGVGLGRTISAYKKVF